MAVKRSSQRGAALLVAMIIVVLVSTLATAMVWQQWRAVQVESAERARSQAGWILLGAGDWARLILREDTGASDNLTEPWALPLQEARLSTFLAADKDNTDDAPDAFLSGAIVDAQSRYNLQNLAVPSNPNDLAAEQALLVNLLDTVGINGGQVGPRIASVIRSANTVTPVTGAASAASGASSAPAVVYVQPQTIDQLAWFGIDEQTIARMRPYVTILPRNAANTATLVNINTASKEVLAAVAGVQLGVAQQWVQQRQSTPFVNLQEAQNLIGNLSSAQTALMGTHLFIKSDYFEVRGRLRLGDKVLEEGSLVVRNVQARTVKPVQRLRESLRDTTE